MLQDMIAGQWKNQSCTRGWVGAMNNVHAWIWYIFQVQPPQPVDIAALLLHSVHA